MRLQYLLASQNLHASELVKFLIENEYQFELKTHDCVEDYYLDIIIYNLHVVYCINGIVEGVVRHEL